MSESSTAIFKENDFPIRRHPPPQPGGNAGGHQPLTKRVWAEAGEEEKRMQREAAHPHSAFGPNHGTERCSRLQVKGHG